MKIDLDELERKAMAASSDDWGRRLANELLRADGDRAHIAANGPPVTLALIARIRELEAAGRVLEERARYGIDDDRKLAEFDAALAILEKGVVLP